MERLLQLAWICLSLTNIEGAIENRGQTLFFFWQSDPRAQWTWIKSELNLAKAVKRDKTIGCREEKGRKKGRGKGYRSSPSVRAGREGGTKEEEG